jgi:hypothetical protein
LRLRAHWHSLRRGIRVVGWFVVWCPMMSDVCYVFVVWIVLRVVRRMLRKGVHSRHAQRVNPGKEHSCFAPHSSCPTSACGTRARRAGNVHMGHNPRPPPCTRMMRAHTAHAMHLRLMTLRTSPNTLHTTGAAYTMRDACGSTWRCAHIMRKVHIIICRARCACVQAARCLRLCW